MACCNRTGTAGRTACDGLHNMSYGANWRGSQAWLIRAATVASLVSCAALAANLAGLLDAGPAQGAATTGVQAAPAPALPGTDPAVLWGYLQNGSGYLVIPEHAAPFIASTAIVHAGSGAEDWSTQGASHFLEHLLFNGTERRTQEQIYDQTDLLGAYNNATTSGTHVAYIMAAPRDQFWGAFDIQQDMLFHSTLPPDKVEKERGIILEELRKDDDDQSYDVERVLDLDLFGPQGYGLPTLGSETSIKSLTRDQILGFYKGFYNPNRVTFVLLGDLDPQAAVDSLNARVGILPAGVSRPLPALTIDRSAPRLRFHELSTSGAILRWAWVLDDPRSDGFEVLRARFEVMCQGDDSPLGRRCLNRWKGRIDSYSADLAEYPGFSVASVRIDLSDPAAVSEVLDGFPQLLAEARAEPSAEDRVEAWKIQETTGELYLREKPHYYGIMRGDLIAARGLAGAAGYLPGIEAVTPARVAALAPPLAWPADRISVLTSAQAAAAPAAAGRSYQEWDLANGARVAALSSPESPVLAIHLFIRERSNREPAGRAGIAELMQNLIGKGTTDHPEDQMGLALSRIGADLKTADDPSIPYDDFYTVPEFSFVRLQTLDRYAPEGFGLLADMLGHPVFMDRDFQEAKGSALGRAARSGGSSRAVASRRLAAWLDPKSGGGDVYGTAATLTPITLEDVRTFAHAYLDPRAFLFVIATSLPLDSLRALTSATLGRIPVPEGAAPVPPLPAAASAVSSLPVAGAASVSPPRVPGSAPSPAVGEISAPAIRERIQGLLADPGQGALWTRYFPSLGGQQSSGKGAAGGHDDLALLADSVGSPQAHVAVCRVFQAPDSLEPALTLANGILSDRLSFDLREKKGLAYSIGANLDRGGPNTWIWTEAAGTGPANLTTMLRGFLDEPKNVVSSPPESLEVAKTAARIYGRGIMRRAARIGWAYYAGLAILDGRDPRAIEERSAALRNVSRRQVLEVLARYWKEGPAIAVVAR